MLTKSQSALTISEQKQLADCEDRIERGLNTFIEVGDALLKIREGLLYRETHSTFEDYCRDRWSMGVRQSQRFINASKVVENLRQYDQTVVIPYSESHIRPLTGLNREQQIQVWENVNQDHEKITADVVEQAVENLKNEGNCFNRELHFSSTDSEWYTPDKIIVPTISLLGEIDLDPCSNCKDNPNVPAKRHFTKDDDGLNQEWQGTVYLNPPYGLGIKQWTEKLVYHYTQSDVSEAIALLPARTDTIWLSKLREFPRCFIRGKLHFSGAPHSAPFPSIVIYLGQNPEKFKMCFEELGDVYCLM